MNRKQVEVEDEKDSEFTKSDLQKTIEGVCYPKHKECSFVKIGCRACGKINEVHRHTDTDNIYHCHYCGSFRVDVIKQYESEE